MDKEKQPELKTFSIENAVIIDGEIHVLTTRDVAHPESKENDPCKLCSLRTICDYRFMTICEVFNVGQENYFVSPARIIWFKFWDLIRIELDAGWKPETAINEKNDKF